MDERTAKQLGLNVQPLCVKPLGVGGTGIPTTGVTEPVTMWFCAGTPHAVSITVSFLVIRTEVHVYEVLLGTKQLKRLGCLLDTAMGQLYFRPRLTEGFMRQLAAIPLRMEQIPTPISGLTATWPALDYTAIGGLCSATMVTNVLVLPPQDLAPPAPQVVPGCFPSTKETPPNAADDLLPYWCQISPGVNDAPDRSHQGSAFTWSGWGMGTHDEDPAHHVLDFGSINQLRFGGAPDLTPERPAQESMTPVAPFSSGGASPPLTSGSGGASGSPPTVHAPGRRAAAVSTPVPHFGPAPEPVSLAVAASCKTRPGKRGRVQHLQHPTIPLHLPNAAEWGGVTPLITGVPPRCKVPRFMQPAIPVADHMTASRWSAVLACVAVLTAVPESL